MFISWHEELLVYRSPPQPPLNKPILLLQGLRIKSKYGCVNDNSTCGGIDKTDQGNTRPDQVQSKPFQ